MNVFHSARQVWHNTSHHRSWWIAAAGAAALVVLVFVFGLCSMVGWAISAMSSTAPRPDETTLKVVDQHDHDAALVAVFAKWCVKLYEEATPATLGLLNQCFTVPPKGAAASQNAATATDLDATAPQLVSQSGDVSFWSVMVAVTVKEFTDSAAVRKYVWLSVVKPADEGPRATLEPADRAAALPAGPDAELAYDHDVADKSLLEGVVSGFITAYLQGPASDVAKYVTAESALTGLGQLYDKVTVESMKSDVPADGPPAPGQEVHVLVTVTGSHSSGGAKSMQYPLLLVEAGGRWAVAGLEDMPAITGRLLPAGNR